MATMDEKTNELIDAAKAVVEACRVTRLTDAHLVSLCEAVKAVERDKTAGILGEIKDAIDAESFFSFVQNCSDPDLVRDALGLAIECWRQEHREGDG